MGLLQGQAGGNQQAGIQRQHRGVLLGGLSLRLPVPLGDEKIDAPLQKTHKGEKQHRHRHVKEGVEIGDAPLINHIPPEGQPNQVLHPVDAAEEHPGAQKVQGKVDKGGPLGAFGGPHAGQHGGDAGADVLAQDDGHRRRPGDGPGGGKGLQNTHRGGGGLNQSGKGRPHQHP